MDAAKVVTKLERIEYVEDPHLGKGSYCVVEMHADVGACSVPDYAVIKLSRHIVQGERPDTIVRGIDEAIQALAKALKSDEVKKFMEEKYEGGVVPLF